MNILLIAHYVGFKHEGVNNRFCYLAELLGHDNNVELVTSDFRHSTKSRRSMPKKEEKKLNYKVATLHEPEYKKNISLKRILCAKVLAKNTKKYLNSLGKLPDVLYCAVPSLDIAKVATKFAKKNNIRLIIDIQDLWPEAFRMAINIPIVSDILFFPMMQKANYIYKNADEIIAVSQTYVDRGKRVNKKARGLSVFLGTSSSEFKVNANNPRNKKYKKFTLAYVGTLGHSYDLETAIKAVSLAKKNGVEVKFLIMGDGPLRTKYEKLAKNEEIDFEFTGKIPYQEVCYRLSRCHAAINPIVGNSSASIINKVGDYSMAGLPVINTQNCQEYRNLINQYRMGYNCKNKDVDDISSKIQLLYKNKNIAKQMGEGANKCAKECFDRNESYAKIVDIIEEQL